MAKANTATKNVAKTQTATNLVAPPAVVANPFAVAMAQVAKRTAKAPTAKAPTAPNAALAQIGALAPVGATYTATMGNVLTACRAAYAAAHSAALANPTAGTTPGGLANAAGLAAWHANAAVLAGAYSAHFAPTGLTGRPLPGAATVTAAIWAAFVVGATTCSAGKLALPWVNPTSVGLGQTQYRAYVGKTVAPTQG